MQLNARLEKLLDYLEGSVDADRQQVVRERHVKALGWEEIDRLPVVMRYPLPADGPFHPFPYHEAFSDMEKMLYNELVYAFETSIAYNSSVGDDLPYTIRANYGVGLVASLFGARLQVEGDSPPWVIGCDDVNAFGRIAKMDPLDHSRGLCRRVVETYEFYRKTMAAYPRLAASFKLVLPDLQGPFDTAALLRGSAIFLDVYDRRELLRDVLAVVARGQVGLARKLQPLLSPGEVEGFSCQHGTYIAGNILVRNDSATMVSADTYQEVIAPHDAFVLQELGGGGIHFCGKGDHLIEAFLTLPGIRSVDFGQSQMNNVDRAYSLAKEKGVALIRVRPSAKELTSGRIKDRFPTGVNLDFPAASFEQACRTMRQVLGHTGYEWKQ